MGKIEGRVMYGIAIALVLTSVAGLVTGIIQTIGANWDDALFGYLVFVFLIPLSLLIIAMKRFIDGLYKVEGGKG